MALSRISHDGLGAACPAYALKALDVLESAGWEAWVVGGWVRDALRGLPGHDVDVTTSAPWQEVERAFAAAGFPVHETGTEHGTVTVVMDGKPVEVTTYRVEGTYSDLRHPDEVRFVRDVREDLARRDFTVNAMAWHPERGLLDPFGGEGDLNLRVIRAVGVPRERFGEDALRVLRAVRFAARMGFSVEAATQEALVACAPELTYIAQERIGQELDGIVRCGKMGWALMNETDVMCAALPELQAMRGFDQHNPYHFYDVLEHTARVCMGVQEFTGGLARPELQWAAFLHDVAKPVCFSLDAEGGGHFFKHPVVGASMADRIMRRLAIRREVAVPARLLVRYHDHRVFATQRSVRRTMQKFSHECPGQETRLTYELLNLKRADAIGKSWRAYGFIQTLDQITALVREEVSRGPVFKESQLAVGGRDLMSEFGMRPGPGIGVFLDAMLVAVVDGVVPNEREALLAWLEEYSGMPRLRQGDGSRVSSERK